MKTIHSFFHSALSKSAYMLVVAMLTVTFTSCEKDDDDDNVTPKPPMETGTDAPDFNLSSTNGDMIKLSSYENKVRVLFFFGNACPSCKAVGPNIQEKLVTMNANNDAFQLIALDQWDGNLASVQAFKQSTGLTSPVLLNASSVASDYSTTYDRLVVVSKDGKIAFAGSQNASKDLDAVSELVTQLLK